MPEEFGGQLAAQGTRSGKFRHIYGEKPKPEKCYKDIKNPLTSGEGSYCVANDKFFAVSRASGGGPVYVLRLDKPGRMPANTPVISVQKGKVLDMDFHPFISNMIATVSEDCSVAVTQFPANGLTANVTKPVALLKGHSKKAALCQFNPSANSILASGSFDRTVRVWNIETSQCVNTFKGMKDNIYSLKWNNDGSQIACTSKDKKLHILDPRIADEASTCDAFDGTKSSKCFWLNNLGWIGALGFSKSAKRQIKLWDLKDLSKPIHVTNLDQTASVNVPWYDSGNGILFYFGKGDGTVSWYEVIKDNRVLYALGSYRSNEPQKGGGFVPKRGLNTKKCEIGRFLKLTKNTVIPIPLIVPRKTGADQFQEDIYPEANAGKPALTADEWIDGQNKGPVLTSLDPEKRVDDDEKEDGQVFAKKKTYAELLKENAQLKKRIKELEAQIGKGDNNNSYGDDKNNDKNDDENQGDEDENQEPDDE